MRENDIDEILGNAVTDFQNTVDALKRIQTISENVANAAGQIDESGANLKRDAERMSELSSRVAEEVQHFSKEANSLAQQVEHYCSEYGEMVAKEVAKTADSSNALREENSQLQKLIQDYTISTQKAVDELRILSNNNSRELREKIDIVEERIISKVGGRLGIIEEMSEELGRMKAQNKKSELLAWVGMAGAVIAAISSILHFFI